MRRIRLASLTLALVFVLGTLSAFASAGFIEPIDRNNPTVKFTLTCRDGKNFDELSFTLNGLDNADIVMDGFAYDLDKTYTVPKISKDLWAVSGTKLYKLRLYSWSEEDGYYETLPGDPEPDFTGSWNEYYYELVPSDEMPDKNMITTYPHKTAKDVIVEKYLVNGKEVSKAEYEKAKTGTYTIKTKKSFTGYGKETVDKEEIAFEGLAKLKQTGPGADSAPWSATFKYRKDSYITAEMNYLRTYEIVKEAGSSEQKPSAPSKPSATAKKPTGTPVIRNTTASTPKKTTTVVWDKSKVKNQTGFEVSCKGGGKTVTKKVGNVTKTTFTGMKLNGLYEIRVRAKNSAGYSAWSSPVYRYFHTTERIRLKAASKGFTISWKRNSSATGYQVMYSTNKNGSGAAKNIKTLSKSATSFSKKGLKKGTTYYVQIRELRKVGGKTYIGNISSPIAVRAR